MARRALVPLLCAAASSDALTLHVKAGPDGTSIGDCPFAHACRIVAGAKDVALDVVPHSPTGKPDWLVQDYEGKMPALKVSDQEVVTESRTIASYLDERFVPLRSLSSSPELDAAEEVCAPVFGAFARYCKSTDDGSEADVELKKNLLLVLCKLDAHLDASTKYLCGGALSMEDAFLLPTLYHITVAGSAFKGFVIPPQYEALHAYYAAAFATPLLQETTPPEPMVRWGWANARGDDAAVQAAIEELAENTRV